MNWLVDSASLRGLSMPTAEKFGKPCVGAHYAGSGVRTNRLDLGARCCVCGRYATNSHHEPATGMGGGRSTLEVAGHRLKPALFALCGSGTTGCHGKVHSGEYRIEWEWDTGEACRKWWEAELPDECYERNSHDLYWYGAWVIRDRDGRTVKRIQEEY